MQLESEINAPVGFKKNSDFEEVKRFSTPPEQEAFLNDLLRL